MSFQYALVARGTTPLAEYSTIQGNYRPIAIKILENLNPATPRTMVEQAGHVFFAITDSDRVTFMCLTETNVSRQIQIAFLEEMQRKWRTRYGNNSGSFMTNSKDAEFGPEMATLIRTYNSERAQKMATIKDNIADAQDKMTNNLTLAMARGEQLAVMEKKAEDISQSADVFKREATNVRRKMCFQHYMWWIIGFVVLAVVIFIIVWICCGAKFQDC